MFMRLYLCLFHRSFLVPELSTKLSMRFCRPWQIHEQAKMLHPMLSLAFHQPHLPLGLRDCHAVCHEQTIIDGGTLARVDWATARQRPERRAVLWQARRGGVDVLFLAAEAQGQRCADVRGVDACGGAASLDSTGQRERIALAHRVATALRHDRAGARRF